MLRVFKNLIHVIAGRIKKHLKGDL